MFSRELLAETDDAELQRIVEKAARELGTQIALVSLVLDQIQFFKAHYGLPPDLQASRGTRRDVSFCQFVVRDGQPFDVTDASNDPRVPQHLVEEYGIRSYLGIPIRLGSAIAGSLCVLDTKPRQFSEQERTSLTELAALVNQRFVALTERRRQVRLGLAERASAAALDELKQSLASLRTSATSGSNAMAAVRSALRLSTFALDGGEVSDEALKKTLQAGSEALEVSEDAFFDVDAAAGDCTDCVTALDHLSASAPSTRLSEVLTAAQDLARHLTTSIGGAPLPHLPHDPTLYAQRPFAVALLTALLTALAAELAERGLASGIQLQIEEPERANIVLVAELEPAVLRRIAEELSQQVGQDPTVTIRHTGGSVRLSFTVVEQGDAAG